MRSLFSNRYDNKRNAFYDRYEAARVLHPGLPLYERPKEPANPTAYDRSSRRRFKSYQELNNQSSEQYKNDDWLASDRLSIVVRRTIEERNFDVLMPRYDPTTATHEFSHNARFRQRGRRPTPSTMAKIVSDFAKQVGGMSTVVETNLVKETECQDLEDSEEIKRAEEQADEIVDQVETDINYNLVDMPKIEQPKAKAMPILKRALAVEENKENIPVTYKFTMPGRIFICPEASCQQEFQMRRSLSKHQRDTGHHSWSHKCDRCGQIFRAAGFLRMHALGACERNLHKKNVKEALVPY